MGKVASKLNVLAGGTIVAVGSVALVFALRRRSKESEAVRTSEVETHADPTSTSATRSTDNVGEVDFSFVGEKWTAWHDVPWEAVLAGSTRADRYFARAGLIRKDRLAKLAPPGCHPLSAEVSLPKTLLPALLRLQVLEKQAAQGLSAARTAPRRSGNTVQYVLKKAHSSNANEMQILTAKELKKAAVALSASDEEQGDDADDSLVLRLKGLLMPPETDKPSLWILQRYIEPHLFHGRKFHLRALFLCVGDLAAYVHENVRCLIATEPFDPARENGGCLLAHITNMGVNQDHPEYNEERQNIGLEELGGAEEARHIRNEIVKILGLTLASVRSAGRRHLFFLPNCWEVFGADFLIEAESRRVVLLELNASPSLAMYKPQSRLEILGRNPLEDIPEGWMPVDLPECGAAVKEKGIKSEECEDG